MTRTAYILVLAPALVAAMLGAFAYLAPETGVEGTTGALLALIGAVAVSIGSAVALRARRGLLPYLGLLLGLAALLTIIAGWFLMQYPFTVAMGLALAGLLFAWSRPTFRAV